MPDPNLFQVVIGVAVEVFQFLCFALAVAIGVGLAVLPFYLLFSFLDYYLGDKDDTSI